MYTSDFVIGRAVTVALVSASYKDAIELGESILNSKTIEKLRIDSEIFMNAWRIFKKYSDKGFNFTDCTSFALMRDKGIKHVFTFDKHFDVLGFVRIYSDNTSLGVPRRILASQGRLPGRVGLLRRWVFRRRTRRCLPRFFHFPRYVARRRWRLPCEGVCCCFHIDMSKCMMDTHHR
jgi:hypothetical protein